MTPATETQAAAAKQPGTVSPSADGDPHWIAVRARDRASDGAFVYSVRTTGVYCRPSCPSRQARPENVRFHATCKAAEAAGFRPCLRCRPNEAALERRHAATIAEACRFIEQADAQPSLKRLAASAGLSPHHFHRLFKSITGVTPKAYADAERARRVRAELHHPEATVTSALYDAGFNSNGRFYEASDKVLGMTPTDFRRGGAGVEIRYAVGESSLGAILVATSARGVCAILLGDDPDELRRDLEMRFPKAAIAKGDESFEQLVAMVVGFIERPRLGLDLPLDIQGTAFQQRVWKALREIPPGATASYSDIAEAVGSPGAVRAVGAACGANPIAVAIPCHRVVAKGGAMTGYRWGVERKRALLKREGVG